MLVKGATGVGVTKPIFIIVKPHISCWLSRFYLTVVTAAQLRWHLWNINTIQRIYVVLQLKTLLLEKIMNGALVIPTQKATISYTLRVFFLVSTSAVAFVTLYPNDKAHGPCLVILYCVVVRPRPVIPYPSGLVQSYSFRSTNRATHFIGDTLYVIRKQSPLRM